MPNLSFALKYPAENNGRIVDALQERAYEYFFLASNSIFFHF